MVYLVATIASDAEHLPTLLERLRDEVAVPEVRPGGGEAWSVGYYADRRPLIIKKPGTLVPGRSIAELAGGLKSQVMLACIKNRNDVGRRSPPYRHGRWLFAHVGDLSGLEAQSARIRERLPTFFPGEADDTGPGALAFAMFRAELQRIGAGAEEDPLIAPSELRQALHRAAEAASGLAREASLMLRAGFVATNGRVIVASRVGAPLWFRSKIGLEASADSPLLADPSSIGFKRLMESLARFRAVVLAHAVREGQGQSEWVEVPEGRTLSVDHQLSVDLGG
ncbi:MAG: hypothetical protein IPK13_16110 [Deltaproteobacteria bacterium]|nr:hypothetical protein [Deltaproteobacteria bacterium]